MDPYIRTLNSMAYILECLVLDYTGEGRTALYELADRLESDPLFAVDDACIYAERLREAAGLRSRCARRALSIRR